MVIIFQNSVFVELHFSQKSLPHKEKQPHTLSQQDLVQQKRVICCCYYKPRACFGEKQFARGIVNTAKVRYQKFLVNFLRTLDQFIKPC